MKLHTSVFVAAGLLASCNNTTPPISEAKAAENQNDQNMTSEQTRKDSEFLVETADDNLMEIEMGRLAMTKGTTHHVIDFGEMMVNHHTNMLNELKSIAVSKSIAIPAELSDESREKVTKLAGEYGSDFDKKYIETMVSDHKKDIRKFERKLKDDRCDAAIRKWVKEGLPTLNHHLDKITEIKQSDI